MAGPPPSGYGSYYSRGSGRGGYYDGGYGDSGRGGGGYDHRYGHGADLPTACAGAGMGSSPASHSSGGHAAQQPGVCYGGRDHPCNYGLAPHEYPNTPNDGHTHCWHSCSH
ncbi:hypothetical protein GE09DRAFT_1054869 [Coniochaeta sp. 2T2.1]|nr:hypothetical protein GE09DRAFT_1054869 [Coniochaeta sp. 2T2.1]